MKSHLLLTLPLLQALVILAKTSEISGVTYYVKPSKTTECPGQPCETLNYYLANMLNEINHQKNVTMVFLNGNHSLSQQSQSPMITTSVIQMIGESKKTKVVASDLEWNALAYHLVIMNNKQVYFQNLVIVNWKVRVIMDVDVLTPLTFNFLRATLQDCWFEISDIHLQVDIEQSVLQGGRYDFRSTCVLKASRFENVNMLIEHAVRAEDCTFLNTPLLAQNIHILISGTTILTATNQTSAITSRFSNVTLSGHISFVNNTGIRGAAIALHSSTLSIATDANITFANNSAKQKGGAIYIEPGVVPSMVVNSQSLPPCFFDLLNCNATPPSYNLYFANNSAVHGGNDIYGASPFDIYCLQKYRIHNLPCNLTVHRSSPSNSSVSSDPLRVCLCDKNGKPLCENNSYTLLNYTVYPGEMFSLPAVLVGKDFGLTTGTLYANVFPLRYSQTPSLSPYVQIVSNIKQCSEAKFSVYSQDNDYVVAYLTTVQLDFIKTLNPTVSRCKSSSCFLTVPVFINFTILPCPPGFALLGDPPQCDCYPVFTEDLSVTCHITSGIGYFSWTGNLWLNIEENGVSYDRYCPYDYCYKGSKLIDLLDNPDSQCEHNRAGILCGRCKEGYSLAIGSSNCITCLNSNNLALLIFFAVAGFLLVICISTLNLTVIQGMVNGLIFYSNIIWTYKEIIFTQEAEQNPVLIFLKTFIAWVNLDFVIETCFVEGLTAFWKTWLQFVFPLYIFSISGLIIVAARYSSRLTKLFGSQAVPLLATLLLLSYMKLLRTAVSALEFSIPTSSEYPNGSSLQIVWSVDGNLSYFKFPHILLFLAGLATLLFLWFPYTLLLLLMQWLRRLPELLFFRWIMRLYPLYDAHFAPLKHKHQYWFGVLLLTQGVLLVTFASTFAIPQNINLVLLLVSGMLLIYFIVLTHPFKSRVVLILQISYLTNLTLLSGFIFFTYTQEHGTALQSIAVGLSTGVAFLQFCGTVLYAVIKPRCCRNKTTPRLEDSDDTINNNHANRAREPALVEHSVRYRDSILNESQPLLPTY